MPVKLEPFTVKDFDRLISWILSQKELVQFAGPLFTFPLTSKQLENYVKQGKLFPKKIIYQNTNAVIGHCELNFSYDLPCLSRILIGDTNYRGKGLGKIIISEMIKEIVKIRPTNKVELRVFDWNENAITLYQKEGFVIQKEKSYTFTYNENETWTSLYMVKT